MTIDEHVRFATYYGMGQSTPPTDDDLIMGRREMTACDPETFDGFIDKARRLGFSAGEIAALKALYAPGKTETPRKAGR